MSLRMRSEYKRRIPCSLLELHQLQLIRFGHLYHMIDVPIHSVGGFIENDKSEVASVVCVVALVCNPLPCKCPLVPGQSSTSGPSRSVS